MEQIGKEYKNIKEKHEKNKQDRIDIHNFIRNNIPILDSKTIEYKDFQTNTIKKALEIFFSNSKQKRFPYKFK